MERKFLVAKSEELYAERDRLAEELRIADENYDTAVSRLEQWESQITDIDERIARLIETIGAVERSISDYYKEESEILRLFEAPANQYGYQFVGAQVVQHFRQFEVNARRGSVQQNEIIYVAYGKLTPSHELHRISSFDRGAVYDPQPSYPHPYNKFQAYETAGYFTRQDEFAAELAELEELAERVPRQPVMLIEKS